LSADELTGRLRALDDLAVGKLIPLLPSSARTGMEVTRDPSGTGSFLPSREFCAMTAPGLRFQHLRANSPLAVGMSPGVSLSKPNILGGTLKFSRTRAYQGSPITRRRRDPGRLLEGFPTVSGNCRCRP
jgi:hypothetical protein